MRPFLLVAFAAAILLPPTATMGEELLLFEKGDNQSEISTAAIGFSFESWANFVNWNIPASLSVVPVVHGNCFGLALHNEATNIVENGDSLVLAVDGEICKVSVFASSNSASSFVSCCDLQNGLHSFELAIADDEGEMLNRSPPTWIFNPTENGIGGEDFEFVGKRAVYLLGQQIEFPLFSFNKGMHKGEEFTIVLFADSFYRDILSSFICRNLFSSIGLTKIMRNVLIIAMDADLLHCLSDSGLNIVHPSSLLHIAEHAFRENGPMPMTAPQGTHGESRRHNPTQLVREMIKLHLLESDIGFWMPDIDECYPLNPIGSIFPPDADISAELCCYHDFRAGVFSRRFSHNPHDEGFGINNGCMFAWANNRTREMARKHWGIMLSEIGKHEAWAQTSFQQLLYEDFQLRVSPQHDSFATWFGISPSTGLSFRSISNFHYFHPAGGDCKHVEKSLLLSETEARVMCVVEYKITNLMKAGNCWALRTKNNNDSSNDDEGEEEEERKLDVLIWRSNVCDL